MEAKVESVVASAEDDSIVVYAEVGNIVLGIRLTTYQAEKLASDLQDRASILIRAERGY